MGNKRGKREGGRDEACNLEFVSSLQDSRFKDSDPGVPLRSTPGYSNYAPSAQRIMSEIHFYRGGTRGTQGDFLSVPLLSSMNLVVPVAVGGPIIMSLLISFEV